MTGQHWNETVLPQSWRRVLGLSSRAVLVTLQRYLDLRSLWIGRFSWNYTTVLLAGMLLLTTVAMQKTMQKHWSARLSGNPHGNVTGWITAILQLSALWEMVDKITTHGRPQMDPQGQAGHLRQPLVGSRPAKGSRGENVMRGVRKMSMVNLPQAMLSLWVHAPQLVRRSEAGSLFWLVLSFMASVACVALGVADFVLYIWVYDAFVKENKKLVTIHYCVEILARVPAVVLFHITYSRHHHYVPTLILFLVDVLLTSLLLLKPRLADFPAGRFSRAMGDRETARTARKRPQDCCCFSVCCCCSCSRQTCSQFLYAMVVAVMLFVLNIVFFDPGMIFFNLNKVFYMIKYIELIVMARLIFQTSSQSGDPVLGVQVSWQTFLVAQLLVTAANIGLVFFYVPCRRSQKDTHLISSQSPHREGLAEMGLQFRSPRSSTLMEVIHTRPLLDRLESIFELLLLLSNADSTHNRRILLAVVVQELSNQSGLDGTYEDDKRQKWRLKLQGETLTCSSEDGKQSSSGFFLQGTDVLLPSTSGLLRGQFDGGKRIQWTKDNKVWMRLEQREDATHTVQDDVLKLILPQLALALRWERHLEVSERPLLHFLIQKSLAPQRMHFMTDLYWALLCLSAEEEVKDVYCEARIELLRQLPPSHKTFLQGQFELLKQVMLLQKHVGKAEGSGAYQVRTELLQNFLRRLRDGERSGTNDHTDFLAGLILEEEKGLLQPATGQPSASPSSLPEVEQHPDLVAPEGIVTLPIDPTSKFQGVIIEECEVLASKQAPIVLSCKMQSLGNGSASRARASGSKSEVRKETSKYLAKVGDDLRQDQLMLQLMDLMEFVWQARLPQEDLKKLRRPKFRVQAITPDMGCVKFVPDSKPLTDALHQSRGDLVAWLEEHKPAEMSRDGVLDNLCGSVAASSVATYVLGIGDRHLENICITRSGHIFHVDFGFVLGDDPKPCAPQVRLPQQVAHALLVTDRLQECFRLAGLAYVNVRPFAGLFASVLHLTAAAGGAGCQKLTQEPTAAVSGVRERLRDQERQTSRAQEEFLCLMRESSEGLASILMDKVHAAGLFWR